MKIYKEEIAGSDKTRILFALGMEEIKLIHGFLNTAFRFFPSGLEWTAKRNRLSNILRTLGKFIKEDEGLNG